MRHNNPPSKASLAVCLCKSQKRFAQRLDNMSHIPSLKVYADTLCPGVSYFRCNCFTLANISTPNGSVLEQMELELSGDKVIEMTFSEEGFPYALSQ